MSAVWANWPDRDGIELTGPMPPTPEQSHTDLVAMVQSLLESHALERWERPTVFRLPMDTGLDELAGLRATLGQWSGRPRSLALDRFVDPTVTEALGLALLEPFGDELVELAGWGHRAHWIGLGWIAVGDGTGTQPVVVFADRPDPAWAGLPETSTWIERLCAITGWQPRERPAVDWRAAEAALGTALPEEYKEIVDVFGPGSFDGYVDLLVPNGSGLDLIDWSRPPADRFAPQPAFPAPQGLLQWGSSEREVDFVWQTGAADPSDWPVLVRTDFDGEWRRFDCSLGEFLARLLTDVGLGFAPSYLLDSHFFESWDR
ncbi:hypothetical protein ACF9IK_00120 [Kitasatospora hibisci]|uniref:hypothetical protein n=1 Tax=Kitasatospora hibisci TaxID=3369522 RepID=UPI0037548B31